jgi:fermentation-respiration switch protein FrsA (DUF1100 family)
MLKQVGAFRPAVLDTSAGVLETRWYEVAKPDTAVLWLGDAGGGFDSPAAGLFDRLAEAYQQRGVGSLRVQFRQPGDAAQVGLDALVATHLLQRLEVARIVVVAWGVSAAGALEAARQFPTVAAVALLAPKGAAATAAAGLGRPLLILHGTGDRVAPTSTARDLLAKADEPKRIVYYPDAEHDLATCAADVEAELAGWLDRQLGVGAPQG